MTTNRTLEDYGAPYEDAEAIENPLVEQSSAKYNRHAEDTAQMSRTTTRANFSFLTITSVATVSAANVAVRSHAGNGSSEKPVVARTALGQYTATFDATYLDGLGESESNVFFWATGAVASPPAIGHVQCTVSSNVISILLTDMTGAAADLTLGTKIIIWAD